jgi:hypothetical protein
MKLLFSCAILLCALTCSTLGQSKEQNSIKLDQTPAYKLLLAQKSIASNELKELRKSYTEGFPDVQDKKIELDILDMEIVRLYGFEPAKYNLLSKCYGELIIQKVQAELDIKNFLRSYTMKHPDLQTKAQTLAKLETEVANYFK